MVTFRTSHRNQAVNCSAYSKMAAPAKERFNLINENLQEILNPELIETILEKGGAPRIYWGKELATSLLSSIDS